MTGIANTTATAEALAALAQTLTGRAIDADTWFHGFNRIVRQDEKVQWAFVQLESISQTRGQTATFVGNSIRLSNGFSVTILADDIAIHGVMKPDLHQLDQLVHILGLLGREFSPQDLADLEAAGREINRAQAENQADRVAETLRDLVSMIGGERAREFLHALGEDIADRKAHAFSSPLSAERHAAIQAEPLPVGWIG